MDKKKNYLLGFKKKSKIKTALYSFPEIKSKSSRKIPADIQQRKTLNYAKNIVQTLRTPLVALTEDFKVLAANKQFYKTFQIPKKAVENKHIYNLGSGGWRLPRFKEILAPVVSKNAQLIGFEFTHTFSKIGERVLLLNARRVYREGKNIQIIILALEDITERKQLAKMHRIEKEKAQKYLDVAGVIIIAANPEGEVTLVNRKGCEVLGYKESDILGKSWVDNFVPRQSRKEQRSLFKDILKKGIKSFEHMESGILTKDGQVRTISWNNTLLYDQKGRVSAILSSGEDITERRKFEDKIQQQNAFLKTIIGSLPCPLHVIDADTRKIKISNLITDLTGDKKGLTCYKALRKRSRPCKGLDMVCPIDEIKRTKKPVVAEQLCYDNSGNLRSFEIHCHPILDKDGNVVQIIEYCFDVTARREAEKVLVRDKENLKKLVEERSRELSKTQVELEKTRHFSNLGMLAAHVAHELRNPLSAIQMATFNIKRKRKNPRLVKHLVNIEKKLLESDKIINNLLFYSRIKTPKYTKVNIYGLLEECIGSLDKIAKERHIAISKDIKGIKEVYIEADQTQIKELFDNILHNALDALYEKKGVISVKAKSVEGKQVILYFRDSGVGIEKDNLKRVYQPFFTTKLKGMGLGLAICYKIVSLHNGRIDVKSRKGKGTIVQIALPLKKSE